MKDGFLVFQIVIIKIIHIKGKINVKIGLIRKGNICRNWKRTGILLKNSPV
jgi:hypothetical protein